MSVVSTKGIYGSEVSFPAAILHSVPVVGIPASLVSWASATQLQVKMPDYASLTSLRGQIDTLETLIQVKELEHRPVPQEERNRLENLRQQLNQQKSSWKGTLEEINLKKSGIVYSFTGIISSFLTIVLSICSIAMQIISPMAGLFGISFGLAFGIVFAANAYYGVKDFPQAEKNIRDQNAHDMRMIHSI